MNIFQENDYRDEAAASELAGRDKLVTTGSGMATALRIFEDTKNGPDQDFLIGAAV
ncbi:hypothetical protein [Amycolatopsis vancoresmycina]|uniref:hypothetical protein n=1 Tax=Amycolatopsis vancoresmycina TaxID=208444 RepID=UPI0012DE76B2|nr:hypothetical protein [Amycolatopsis vancoresmycina]